MQRRGKRRRLHMCAQHVQCVEALNALSDAPAEVAHEGPSELQRTIHSRILRAVPDFDRGGAEVYSD
eukprot:3191659-Amphidinium_carterae.1